MTILQALAKAYDRLAENREVPAFNYSSEHVHAFISIDSKGRILGRPSALSYDAKGKLTSRRMNLPYFGGRSGIKPPPYFLWDNTAYVLGLSAKETGNPAARHQSWRDLHLHALSSVEDERLRALLKFAQTYTVDEGRALLDPELYDKNLVFRFEDDRQFLHETEAAKILWASLAPKGAGVEGICLITGVRAPIARLHHLIKGVRGAQSSGAAIISYNADAFESYHHKDGDNAPVSEIAEAAYTSALNRFLASKKNRIQIGDASTVFWADCEDANQALEAEDLFLGGLGLKFEESVAEEKALAPALKALTDGTLLATRPNLDEGIRFHVLGLAPNAARLSVRYWFDDDFSVVVRNLSKHVEAMRIEPPPRQFPIPLWLCLKELASQGKVENIPPNLAGEWLRAILTGAPWPLTLQSTLLMRMRADRSIDAMRAAMIKACLVTRRKKVPVSLDLDNGNRGYLLGRLFATYEQIQSAALGGINATIRDKFYGAASATPRKVYPVLDRGSANHLGKLRRDKPGYAVVLEKQIAAIMAVFEPSREPFPTALNADEQSLFAVGYYHQKSEFFKKKDDASSDAADIGSA